MAASEKTVQKNIMQWLMALGYCVEHVPAGGPNALHRAMMHHQGYRKGFPDIIVLDRNGRVGFMEVKTARGKLSADQVWWRDEMAQRNMPYAVVRTIADAETAIDEWGWLDNEGWG